MSFNKQILFPNRNKKSKKGQSLMELVVVIGVGVIVLSALTFATIAALRNAQRAKVQAQATKYAQEGIEYMKILRDRNPTPAVNGYSITEAWDRNDGIDCVPPPSGASPCVFKLVKTGENTLGFKVSGPNISFYEDSTGLLGLPNTNNFKRMILIENAQSGNAAKDRNEKRVTSKVTWEDYAGVHESTLVTILAKP